ncbi:MAG TPA: type II toxin-antitoxin system VapC family toxin [Dehalococcoidia bacterium]|nr:type II toxin-antitoxin system VapC family toxin [Dehalococcoidia bacterium]
MNLLLDTQVLLWWLGDEPSLGDAAREVIARGRNQIYVSAASVWEISIKQALGKLEAPGDLLQQLEAGGFEPLPISLEHAYAAGSLPRHHDDPFDRMLVAQAQVEGFALATADPRMSRYDVEVLPAS